MKNSRPRSRVRESRSFGPLGDLIRSNRLKLELGLAEVAEACQCSVQFVSNIEHGRAPLPWEKVERLSAILKIPAEEIQAANLAIRSDFKSFVTTSRASIGASKSGSANGAASAVAFAARLAAKDSKLREVIERYQGASAASRKRFVRAAMNLLVE